MTNFFIQGMGTPWQIPAHIVVLVGLGLLLGQQGFAAVRAGLLVFVLSVLIGLGLIRVPALTWDGSMVLLTLAGVTGILLALRLELPLWLGAVLTGVGGVLIGMGSAPLMIPGLNALKIYTELAGTAVSTSVTLLALALLASLLRTLLNGIVLRVLGSWVAASALMVLALLFVPH